MATAVVSPITTDTTSALSEVFTTATTSSIDSPKADHTTKFSWQSGPIPLITTPVSQTDAQDQYTHAASEMALVHNYIIRALNGIYLQSPHIPASEHTNFMSYCLAAYNGLCAHHDGEEAQFFPELEKLTGESGLMEENIQGHRDFDTNFGAWGTWLQDCLARKETLSSETNRKLMEDFFPPLSTHLHDEIPTILALGRFGDKLDLRAIMKEEGDKAMGSMDKRTVLPIFFFNHDDTFEGGRHVFPPLPSPVKWVLKNVFGRSRSAWWKFACCEMDGRPRELRFVGKE